MKTLNVKIENYIIEAIDTEGRGFFGDAKSPRHLAHFLARTFVNEYCHIHNTRRYKTPERTLKEYIMGLPSCFNIDFENHYILEKGVELKLLSPTATDSEKDVFLHNWFDLIAEQTMLFFKKHGAHYLIWKRFDI